ncbi:L-aspartate oxidase [Pelagirhabdus alkalitolerans]|uniref:L-aspartate oxidase n=1 Tax=Pelagirhabdus alkalitolerans TaxID=1612202 RepID=A0A1G6HIV9_9BACI|nr:L-aspartate oxidase [Pelagirhabdus alkalitolerans]SDB94134.1 L-aspartate oxidase [Pelagirhabdus alkalitolerans]
MDKRKMLIIGAGLSAYQLAKYSYDAFDVTIVTKGSASQCNSMRAQGGIAAAIHSNDHPDLHLNDTLKAGSYYNDVNQVNTLVKGAKDIMDTLVLEGFQFDKNSSGALSSGFEGAHQKKRIFRAGGDQTGKYLIEFYQSLIEDHISLIENHLAVDLIAKNGEVKGVITIDQYDQYHVFNADVVILATGGYGGIYDRHSNDETTTGDGISLAYRAGAEVLDLEFVQFHPTLFKGKNRYHLISEAVRGEGACLIDERGTKILAEHPMKDLAPRDIVSQEITSVLEKGSQVYLDITKIPNFKERFPSIYESLIQEGYSIHKPVSVEPGAHFSMGGVRVDENGMTSIKDLYAVGEVSAHRLHGANRLASNSLLETLVFPKRLALYLDNVIRLKKDSVAAPLSDRKKISDYPSLGCIKEKNRLILGVLRNQTSLLNYKQWLDQYELDNLVNLSARNVSRKQIEKEHILIVSHLVLNHCIRRKESLGAHVINKYQDRSQNLKGVLSC